MSRRIGPGGLSLDAVIEIHCFRLYGKEVYNTGFVNYFVNCPIGVTLNEKIANPGGPVGRFVVHYKRRQNESDNYERLRFKNYLYSSKQFYFDGCDKDT